MPLEDIDGGSLRGDMCFVYRLLLTHQSGCGYSGTHPLLGQYLAEHNIDGGDVGNPTEFVRLTFFQSTHFLHALMLMYSFHSPLK
jgi:hypothetical protein